MDPNKKTSFCKTTKRINKKTSFCKTKEAPLSLNFGVLPKIPICQLLMWTYKKREILKFLAKVVWGNSRYCPCMRACIPCTQFNHHKTCCLHSTADTEHSCRHCQHMLLCLTGFLTLGNPSFVFQSTKLLTSTFIVQANIQQVKGTITFVF